MIIATGINENLYDASKIAVKNMIRILERYNFKANEAYLLCSVVDDLRISESLMIQISLYHVQFQKISQCKDLICNNFYVKKMKNNIVNDKLIGTDVPISFFRKMLLKIHI